ncbi:carboxypeptidase-like regulatory domain-containing protein [Pseudochryseolinea flava]|uniref:Carboxypeptidase-like regulatory domain-containing protein n=1 Tax=Pseudochryseolinea flava TaxID=2059302 RepID=A0A364XXU4_9BACT|nr:carboxypeptidase-like regulatory domain-containing protein [Pseudochryseolinea flava]RAV99230.1 hypothetical protein DQQ10_20235 [Pseudochryseolinea flava]
MKRVLSVFIPMLLLAAAAFGQDVPVSGFVNDENDKPVPGVNIIVKGTSHGTVTKQDGSYTIDVPKGQLTILFMLNGYKKFQQKFDAKNGLQYLLDVKLVADNPANVLLKSYGEMGELKPQ